MAKLKEVLEILVKGKHKQYLLKSETKHIPTMCANWGEVTVKIASLTPAAYNAFFGRK